MIVHQIYADNPLRNFHYLIACPESRDALVIDPLDVSRCLDVAAKHDLKITKILNTHEHWDHVDGNAEMKQATGAIIYAHHGAMDKIGNVDIGLKAGDEISIGTSVTLTALDTPGHTMSHLCLLSNGKDPALFCGDTLFNAGAGNCHHGGDPDILYDTFSQQLDKLPDDTRIYPGHDYIVNNLEFTLDREPSNAQAQAMLEKLKGQDPHDAYITTMADERRINSFFRLENPAIIKKLKSENTKISDTPKPREIFKALRELRNHW
ncbi:MAG: hydroxyacylglutathione hydrolase [Alphaproteobacteria bacterium]|nr:hydroxyacylglutathione hydrolase [Alphaproteobacteria bacterium]